jgi:hypothetical protein
MMEVTIGFLSDIRAQFQVRRCLPERLYCNNDQRFEKFTRIGITANRSMLQGALL